MRVGYSAYMSQLTEDLRVRDYLFFSEQMGPRMRAACHDDAAAERRRQQDEQRQWRQDSVRALAAAANAARPATDGRYDAVRPVQRLRRYPVGPATLEIMDSFREDNGDDGQDGAARAYALPARVSGSWQPARRESKLWASRRLSNRHLGALPGVDVAYRSRDVASMTMEYLGSTLCVPGGGTLFVPAALEPGMTWALQQPPRPRLHWAQPDPAQHLAACGPRPSQPPQYRLSSPSPTSNATLDAAMFPCAMFSGASLSLSNSV